MSAAPPALAAHTPTPPPYKSTHHWHSVQALVHVVKLCRSRKEILSLEALHEYVRAHGSLFRTVIRSVDLSGPDETAFLAKVPMGDSMFIGCKLQDATTHRIYTSGGLIFPDLSFFPYRAFRTNLYTAAELMAGYNPAVPGSFFKDTLDSHIYHHYDTRRQCQPLPVIDMIGQRLHDTCLDHALDEYLHTDNRKLRTVGIMGGHGLKRTDDAYRMIVHLGFALARRHFVVATGGGPGAMEAGNLGAWLSRQGSSECIDGVISMLAPAPTFRDAGWFETAHQVLTRYPHGNESIGVPTWYYGHEPSNLFSSHIAKYFSNSLREDGLITIACAGIVFAPGSAGTVQEIFQNVCQNHYGSNGVISPMVFLGENFWTVECPVYPLVRALAKGRAYEALITLCDTWEEAVRFIETHPPIVAAAASTAAHPIAVPPVPAVASGSAPNGFAAAPIAIPPPAPGTAVAITSAPEPVAPAAAPASVAMSIASVPDSGLPAARSAPLGDSVSVDAVVSIAGSDLHDLDRPASSAAATRASSSGDELPTPKRSRSEGP
eukprot:m.80214 g.80214  ORF g.80214 m.80214 type:complete len:547 (-) comp8030_c0_seq1:127-1767(-)